MDHTSIPLSIVTYSSKLTFSWAGPWLQLCTLHKGFHFLPWPPKNTRYCEDACSWYILFTSFLHPRVPFLISCCSLLQMVCFLHSGYYLDQSRPLVYRQAGEHGRVQLAGQVPQKPTHAYTFLPVMSCTLLQGAAVTFVLGVPLNVIQKRYFTAVQMNHLVRTVSTNELPELSPHESQYISERSEAGVSNCAVIRNNKALTATINIVTRLLW